MGHVYFQGSQWGRPEEVGRIFQGQRELYDTATNDVPETALQTRQNGILEHQTTPYG